MSTSTGSDRILDPDAAALLDSWLARSAVPVHEQPLEQSRNSGLVGPEVTGPVPALWSVENSIVEGGSGVAIPVRIYRPEPGDDLPVLVYSHGGGWTLLSIDSSDVLCRHLAIGARCVIVSVGYRLAPEHPFPAAFDDVHSVVEWIAAGGLGRAPKRLALGGDSAGGNLSAGLSTHLRDIGGPAVDFQLLLYPSLGTDLDTPSMRELGPDPRFRLQPPTMRWFWRNYFDGAETHDDPRAVPARAESFSGLPRTLVVTCGFDPLRDDGARYGEALRAAGVEVEVFEARTLPHGFAMMLGAVPAARDAFAAVVTRVRSALHPAIDDDALPAIAREFKDRPFGRHSADLQLLLHELRSAPMSGKHFLFMSASQREWVLGRYSDGPPFTPILDWDTTFDDLEAAEWHVFKVRWREKFGTELPGAAGAGEPSALNEEQRQHVLRSPAVLGYADRRSVRAGESITFFVSSAAGADYDAQLFRITSPDIGPLGSPFKAEPIISPIDGVHPGTEQPLVAGSSAFVPGPLPLSTAVRFDVLVFPTLVDHPATIACFAAADGTSVTIELDPHGLRATVGRGDETWVAQPLPPPRDRSWSEVTLAVDLGAGRLSLRCAPQATEGYLTRPAIEAAATWSPDRQASLDGCTLTLAEGFNGKLERPRVFGAGPQPIAEWDFSLDVPTESIRDIGPSGWHGVLRNMPARGTRGIHWTGESLSWVADPAAYAAIHFHDDDVADAGWDPAFTLDLAADLPSACYAIRLQPVDGATPEFWVPFVVRPAAAAATQAVAFVVPTTTYGAYANMHLRVTAQFNELAHGRLTVLDSTDFLLLDHPELGKSTYDVHRDGSPVLYSSMNRPVTNFRPTGRMYKFCLDLMITDWLDAIGIEADIITDDDLHVEGLAALAPYRVAITGSHPEYLTRLQFDAFEQFTRRGGRLMYLGGNGFYSAAEIPDHRLDVTEVRRPGQDNLWRVNHAEGLFSTSGRPGGMWRNIGRPENAITGVGFITQGFDACTHYTRTAASYDERTAWIFDGLDPLDVIGDFGVLQGGAAGYEIDRHEVTKGSPPHSVVVASSGGHSNVYDLMVPSILDTLPDPARTQDPIRADMVLFETDAGGAVFSVGSIAWAGSLGHNGFDNSVSRVTANVVRRFRDATPFVPPADS